jgi:hypothetical protein
MQRPDPEEAECRGIRTLAVFTQPRPNHLAEIAPLIDAGEVRVFVNRTFP